MKAIETRGLTRKFGHIVAVRDLDLNVDEGRIYGFLGPNGAGKSTTIHMLMGFVKPGGGSARVFGRDIRTGHDEIRGLVGYLPERPAFYEYLSGAANMRYFGRLMGLKDVDARIAETVRQVGLEGREHHRVGTYSHGMRQRLGIAVALLGRPRLLILDEPTVGLDPQGSHDIREIIRRLKSEHVTIFLSSHVLYEVQAISDAVGIVKDGHMIVERPTADFIASMKGARPVFEFSAPGLDGRFAGVAGAVRGVAGVELKDGRMLVTVESPEAAADVNIALVNAGLRVREIKEIMPTLEEAFLQAVNEKEG